MMAILGMMIDLWLLTKIAGVVLIIIGLCWLFKK